MRTSIIQEQASLRRRRLTGAAQVVASSLGYGMLGVFGKRAYAAGIRPGELLALRFLLASIILWAYVLLLRRGALRISLKQALACALLGVAGYAVFTTLYFHALESMSASLTVLLLYTYPVMVMLGAVLLFKERVTLTQAMALPAVCVGMLMLLWRGVAVMKGAAVWLAMGAAFFYALYILASSRLLRSINPLAAGLIIMTAACITFLAWEPPTAQRITMFNEAAWATIIALALVSTVGPLVLFLSGLEKLTSMEASLLSAVEPVTTTVAAALLLHETLSALQVAGGILILAALIFTSLDRRGKVSIGPAEL